MPNGFTPSGERGRALDWAMRHRLADSLSYVFSQLGSELGIDPMEAARIERVIREHRQPPQLFGCYYDLVIAVEQNRADNARDLAAEIRQRGASADPEHWARSLTEYPDVDRARYCRLLLPQDIVATDPEETAAADAKQRIVAAMDLLDRGYPAMADEIRALLYEIVLAAGPTEPKAMTFDGSSAFMLWGAIMLNVLGQTTVLDTAQALAHESGHNLLFGKCVSGPLVENDDEEAFSHPLRLDPRPMDGVFHAAYVIARMHQTLEALLRSGALDSEQTEAARADLALHQKNFAAADEVIRGGGRLTPLGLENIEQARQHMLEPAI